MSVIKSFFAAFFIFCLFFSTDAGNLKRIRKALESEKFAKAEKRILKSLKKDSLNPGAKYYLSKLLVQQNYNAQNIDSSWYWINRAMADLHHLNKDIRKDLRKAELDSNDFRDQRAHVAELAFERAVSQMTVAAFERYLQNYQNTWHIKEAISTRDSLAFDAASDKHTWQAYEHYFQVYPNSTYVPEARKRYQSLIFKDYTKDDRLDSYTKFLEDHPGTPFRRVAEEIIFTRSILDHEWDSYLHFLETYPDTYLRKRIGDILYYKSKNDGYFNLELVLNVHSDPDSLRTAYELEKRILFPIFEGGVFGFMSLNEEMILKPQYEHIADNLLCGNVASEWLHIENKVINRKGEVILTGISDFKDLGYGVALVRRQNRRLYHNSGFRISDLTVDNARVLTDGLIAYQAGYDWGIMSLTGHEMIPPHYQSVALKGHFVIMERDDLFQVAGLDQLLSSSETVETNLLFDDYEVIGDTLLQGFAGEQECLIDKNMNFLIPLDTHSIYVTRHNWYVKDASGYQIFDKKNTELMNRKFPFLQANEGWISLKQEDNSGWLLISKMRVDPVVIKDLDSVRLIDAACALIQKGDTLALQFQNGKQELLQQDETIQILSEQSVHFLLLTSGSRQRVFAASGELLFKSRYEGVSLLSDSVFSFDKKGKVGILDKNGTVLVPARYDLADEHDGLVFLLKNQQIGCYDIKRNLLIPAEYQARIFSFGPGHYSVKKVGKIGLSDTLNRQTVPTDYDQLIPWNDTTLWARQNDRWKLITYDNAVLLEDIRAVTIWFESEGETFCTILAEDGLGLLSNRNGELLPPQYNDILNLGSEEVPLFFAEQHLKAAAFYIVTYLDRRGTNIRSQAFRPEEYEKIYCDL